MVQMNPTFRRGQGSLVAYGQVENKKLFGIIKLKNEVVILTSCRGRGFVPPILRKRLQTRFRTLHQGGAIDELQGFLIFFNEKTLKTGSGTAVPEPVRL